MESEDLIMMEKIPHISYVIWNLVVLVSDLNQNSGFDCSLLVKNDENFLLFKVSIQEQFIINGAIKVNTSTSKYQSFYNPPRQCLVGVVRSPILFQVSFCLKVNFAVWSYYCPMPTKLPGQFRINELSPRISNFTSIFKIN